MRDQGMVTIRGRESDVELTREWIKKIVSQTIDSLEHKTICLTDEQRKHFIRPDGGFINTLQKIIDIHHVQVIVEENSNKLAIVGSEKRVSL